MARRRRRGSATGTLKGLASLVALLFLLAAARFVLENASVFLLLGAGLLAIGGLYCWVRRGRELAQQQEDRRRLLGYELAELDRLTGSQFEAWIAAVLTEAGFLTDNIRTSGDFGVDVVAQWHGTRIGIQAKRYRSKVGNDAVQEAHAGADYHGCRVAAVVTQSTFTRAAKLQAANLQRPCLLIGRTELPQLARILREAAEDS